ncbi:Lrp/AsnC family transcriptional regulator [Candidatus Pyrohabitans sp.]
MIPDEKDLKIIDILRKDARTPFTEIARRLHVSEATVRKRVDVLEKMGIIKGYTIVVDPAKMGYGTVALVGINTNPDMFLSVAEKLTEFEEVRFVATSTGDHMIMAEVWTRNGKELSSLISEKIGKLEGITHIRPAIILEKLKEI